MNVKRVLVSAIAAAGLVSGTLASGLLSPATAVTPPPYTVQTLHFAVKVGPSQQVCDIVGDLYVPTAASATQRVPAILTTNGFGGSKNDQAGLGKYGASNGYVVLSYSGLGFGGSGCQITLDDPAYDGVAGSQLVSYLGGAPGIAFLDAAHKQPAPTLNVVVHDAHAHDGKAYTYDPRVGMIGGSYGGEIQFAVAGVDPRMDTIIPMITWNDLSYSLAPNNANQVGTTVSSSTPGDAKVFWALGFSAIGVVDGLQGAQSDPSRLIPCPNFATWVCPGLAIAGATGTLDSGTEAHLKSASVATYMSKIKIPVLLAQGEFDTLFNLNEAVATYQALSAQHTPVSMIWHSWGHSSGSPQPGEFDSSNPDPTTQYETARVFNWFAHYLKGQILAPTGPAFAYFRDWVPYTGIATPAFGTATSYGNFPKVRYYLGSSALTTGAASGTKSQTFVTLPGGLPTSMNPIDAIGSTLPIPQQEKDLPGTFASWVTPTLGSNLDVVGSPVLHLKVVAPVSGATAPAGPLTNLVLFVRLRDVARDGTATDIRQLTAPIRVNPNLPCVVRLPAIVHQFAAGHKLELVIAGGSINYRGGLTGNVVTIAGGSTQTLDRPTP
ncbi:MAG: CocE/NonD family hydrolase [Marmoricola sp.]